jgi:hypothetical protein
MQYKVGDLITNGTTTARVVEVHRCSGQWDDDAELKPGTCQEKHAKYLYECEDMNGNKLTFGWLAKLALATEEPMPTETMHADVTPDPWDASESPDPALATAERAELVEDQGEVIKALLQQVAALQAKRAASVKRAADYRKRWHQASESVRSERHARRNKQTTINMQRAELAATKSENVKLRAQLDAIEKAQDSTQLEPLIAEAEAALKAYGQGMYYAEIKHLMRCDNATANRALSAGVTAGRLVKRSGSNYYTLPEYEARRKASEAASDPGEELSGLPLLNPRATKRTTTPPPVRKMPDDKPAA